MVKLWDKNLITLRFCRIRGLLSMTDSYVSWSFPNKANSYTMKLHSLWVHPYTQSQKKRTMKSLASPGTQGQGQVTPAGSYFFEHRHQEHRQNEIQHKVYISTLLRKRRTTFHGAFLLRLSVVAGLTVIVLCHFLDSCWSWHISELFICISHFLAAYSLLWCQP